MCHKCDKIYQDAVDVGQLYATFIEILDEELKMNLCQPLPELRERLEQIAKDGQVELSQVVMFAMSQLYETLGYPFKDLEHHA